MQSIFMYPMLGEPKMLTHINTITWMDIISDMNLWNRIHNDENKHNHNLFFMPSEPEVISRKNITITQNLEINIT